MSGPGDPGPQTGGKPLADSSGHDSRSERRSLRHHAERRKRAGRLFWAAGPALAVVIVVAVLFPLLVSPGQGSAATVGGSVTGGSSGSATSTASGSALLVVEQDGRPAVLALIAAGAKGGLVLGLPAVTILRSGDRFAQISTLYVPGQPETLTKTLSEVLGAPVGAVATVQWSALRDGLADSGVQNLPPEQLDQQDGDAGAVAGALAAALATSGAAAAQRGWEAALEGDPEGFRAVLAAALARAGGTVWTGRGITGTLVDSGALTYLEPDVKTARSLLAGTGGGG
jgi:hypothetical protein